MTRFPHGRILSAVALSLLIGLSPVAAAPDPDGMRTLAVAIGGRRVVLAADVATDVSVPVAFETGTSRLSGAGQGAVRRFAKSRESMLTSGRTLLVAVQVPAGRPEDVSRAIQRAQVIRDRLVLTLKAAREDAVVAAALVGGEGGSPDEPQVLFAAVEPADASADLEDVRRRMRTLALDSMFAAQAVAQWEAPVQAGSAQAPSAPVATAPAPASAPPRETPARTAPAPAAVVVAPMPRPAVSRDPGARPVPLERFGPAVVVQPRSAPQPATAPANPRPTAPKPAASGRTETAHRDSRPASPVAAPAGAPSRPWPIVAPDRPSVAQGATGGAATPGPARGDTALARSECLRPERILDDFYPGGPIVPCPER